MVHLGEKAACVDTGEMAQGTEAEQYMAHIHSEKEVNYSVRRSLATAAHLGDAAATHTVLDPNHGSRTKSCALGDRSPVAILGSLHVRTFDGMGPGQETAFFRSQESRLCRILIHQVTWDFVADEES